MYTIRSAGPNKGLGVFATTLIPRGTRIFSEPALIGIAAQRNGESLPKDLFESFHTILSQKQQQRLLDLSSYPGEGIGRLGRWGSAVLYAFRQRKSGKVVREGKNVWARIQQNKTILDIWRSNSFCISHPHSSPSISTPQTTNTATSIRPPPTTPGRPSTPTSTSKFHLFPTIARLNHSCLPNAQANFHPLTSHFNVHALHSIPAGTEIQLSYLGEHGALREKRREKLSTGYGFLCACPACDMNAEGTESEREGGKRAILWEEERVEMQGRLAEFAATRANGVRGGKEEEAEDYYYDSEGNREVIPRSLPSASSTLSSHLKETTDQHHLHTADLERELAITQSYIAMLETQGVSGREIATIYYSIASILDKLGRKGEAVEKAERGLRIDGDCLGVDHPLYGEAVGFVEGLRT